MVAKLGSPSLPNTELFVVVVVVDVSVFANAVSFDAAVLSLSS